MNIAVLVKQVPDTATRIKIRPGAPDIEREGLTMVVNPYDEFAIEEALRQKEAHGGTVTLVTLGDARAEEALRTGLAMGADEAVRLDGVTQDPLVAARALHAYLKTASFDLILAGKQAVDGDNAQVGPLVADLLDIPQVTVAVELVVDPAGRKGRAKQEIEGGHAVWEFTLPAVVTAQKGLNEPRYPSLPGIMKAKRKEIAVHPADLASDPGLLVLALTLPEPRKAGTIIKGLEPEAAARELARLLHEDAKAI